MRASRVPRAMIVGVEGMLVRVVDRSAWRSWEVRLGLPPGGLKHDVLDSPPALRALLGMGVEADVWMELACLYRLRADEMRALARDFWAAMRVDAGLAAFIRSLRSHLRTALLANAWPQAQARYCDVFGLGDVADTVIISADERLVMPDTRIYEVAAARLGVSPAETLFVDASEVYVAGARDAGMQALRIMDRDQLIAGLRRILEPNGERTATAPPEFTAVEAGIA